jgi:hypothetical protein
VASRNARWQADQERNAESCERANQEEDYEFVQSKNVRVQGQSYTSSQSPDIS